MRRPPRYLLKERERGARRERGASYGWRVDFSTRPVIAGHFGVVASTHWIASQVGMAVLERGGNAFDAACAAGFVLHVVEPHMNGIAGDAVMLAQRVGDDEPTVICGQGTAPAAATIEAVRRRGVDMIPGIGVLPAVVPGAFDAWMLLLRNFGTISVADALGPAIEYASEGVPVYEGLHSSIVGAAAHLARWPDSLAEFMPSGVAPAAGSVLRRPRYAATLDRLAGAAEGRTRHAQIDAVRNAFYRGFVAEAIDQHCVKHEALLCGRDLSTWAATEEAPLSIGYRGWTVFKASTWTQGITLLIALGLLDRHDLAHEDDAAFVHRCVEALKLALADREAWVGDPAFYDVPVAALLSQSYLSERAHLLTDRASRVLLPGAPAGRRPQLPPFDYGGRGSEPTAREWASPKTEGDTCHLDVIDRWGNCVAVTPSGGWLQSSPVVAELGFPLGTRGQMFWLAPGLANSLHPGARPRTTLTPSLAHGPSGERMVFGTPGGDSQEQWQLQFLVNVVDRRMSLQYAIDAPYYQTNHAPDSFFPRRAQPNRLVVESRFSPLVLGGLERRGHELAVVGDWVLGRNCAALRHADGRLVAAASPRSQQAYAVGR